ncbi:GNAT family N-acetyltransferase [Epilithonimonas zeae]|uniref:GNAT family N-acetyltransferase n=1 Tax=Epilithonimonas zeae TaxID=1416779 RepID=UPI002010C366|nr:GNAT family N-acetyltransferase [Epilithonimonas zeae]UQB70075.1 GNAT family N-acetyltransferase [Epilithonimonas zeae]
MSIIIRENKKEDNKILAKIIRTSFHDFEVSCTNGTVYSDPTTDDLYSLFQTGKSALFVAEENGLILGCCGIFPTENLPENTTELVKFYLTKEARGKGIGKLLMEKCVEKAKELGYQQVYLESLPEFSKAVSIYEKQGFRYLEKALGNSGHSGCNLWMIKKLD